MQFHQWMWYISFLGPWFSLIVVSLWCCCTFCTPCSLSDSGWRLPWSYPDGWRRRYNCGHYLVIILNAQGENERPASMGSFSSILHNDNVQIWFLLSIIIHVIKVYSTCSSCNTGTDTSWIVSILILSLKATCFPCKFWRNLVSSMFEANHRRSRAIINTRIRIMLRPGPQCLSHKITVCRYQQKGGHCGNPTYYYD